MTRFLESDLFSLFVCQLNPPGLLTMPRSPTSSEDEMAQSFSDYSDDCASDSSREETIYETIRATAEPSQNRMDDIHINSQVVRVLIPDLQQTVSMGTGAWRCCVWLCGSWYEVEQICFQVHICSSSLLIEIHWRFNGGLFDTYICIYSLFVEAGTRWTRAQHCTVDLKL